MQLQEPKARESLLTPSMRESASRSSLKISEIPTTPTTTTTSTSTPTLPASSSLSLSSSSGAPSTPVTLAPASNDLDSMSPLSHVTAANAALLERPTFAIDDAKDEEEEDEEEGEADIEDSQILEDLPDETEVRYLSTSLFSTW